MWQTKSMKALLDNWSSEMTTHIQPQNIATAQASIDLPRPSTIAVIAGLFWAALLVLISLPLLVAGGLWLLGMGLALLGYAVVSVRRFQTAVWDTAIIGQGLGLLGMALLFGASLLG
jgi:hypothetical protein